MKLPVWCHQNCFSENEHFRHQLAEMMKLLHFTTKVSMLCTVLIGVLCSLNGTSCIVCVSVVRIQYELYEVKRQSASSPVTVDLREKQKLNM